MRHETPHPLCNRCDGRALRKDEQMASNAKRAGPSAGGESLAGDFGLILEAVAEAFRTLSASAELDTHWSELRSGEGER
jgi:hypothetical protein